MRQIVVCATYVENGGGGIRFPGAVLGVFRIALAVQMLLLAARMLGIMASAGS